MKKMFLFLSVAFLLAGCSEEKNDVEVTAETVVNTPNMKEFKLIAAAIDNLEVSSAVGLGDQLGDYLDHDGSKGLKKALENAKAATANTVTAKGQEGYQAVDLDKELLEAGFTDVQKEFISKITTLYPLEDSISEKVVDDDVIVGNIKEGLLKVRNEVFADERLSTAQKEQLYVYVDLQYSTLESIVNYAEKLVSATQTGKWKISFKKIVNIVVSVVVTTAVGAVVASVKGLNMVATVIGAASGFASGVVSAVHNRCIKVCGTGFCNTAWNDCDTGNYFTSFTLKYD